MRTGLASFATAATLVAAIAGCSSDAPPSDEAEGSHELSSPPTAEPAAEAGSSAATLAETRRLRRQRAVEGAVRDFYAEVDLGDYEAAWSRLSEPVRSDLGGYDAWRRGYQFSVSTRAFDVRATEVAPRSAVVLFTLRSRDVDACAEEVAQRFAGRWALTRVGQHWLASSIGAEKVAGATPAADIEECPGYSEPPPATGDVPEYDHEPDYDPYLDEPDNGYEPGYDYEPDYDYEDVPPGPPTTETFGEGKGSIGRCEDGTLSDSIGRQGACSHHGGVAP